MNDLQCEIAVLSFAFSVAYIFKRTEEVLIDQ